MPWLDIAATVATLVALKPWWGQVRRYRLDPPVCGFFAAATIALHMLILGGIWL